MAKPLVSLIIRSTARPTLDDALACVAAQTWPEIETLVVAASGASHPPLPATAGRHRLRLVESATPLSRPAAGNAGLDAARGEWITFLDDDDRIEPAHVEGLVEAALRGNCKVLTSLAQVRLANGTMQSWGQPFAVSELYVRNFLHLSTVLFARELVIAGCRFDESFDIMQDWDLFLQLAQHAPFGSIGQRTFVWNADAGTSGTGGDANSDAKRFAEYRDRIYAKWGAARDALGARLEPLLGGAGQAIEARDFARADALCRQALDIAPNEPHALNMLAMLMDAQGRRNEAMSMQSMAASVRPHEPAFLFNLARLAGNYGQTDRARRIAEYVIQIAPDFTPAKTLLEELARR